MKFETTKLAVESYDNAWLDGVLELPENPRAIAVTVHGSFPQDRAGNIDSGRTWLFPHPIPRRDLFLSFRDAALPTGVGTYRYDKRASGASEGIWAQTDFLAISQDLLFIFRELKRRHPKLLLGFVGQSEGCLTSLKAIELGATPDFFISQGGALESFVSLIDRQKDRAAKAFLEDQTGKLEEGTPFLSAFYRSYFSGQLRDEIVRGTSRTLQLTSQTGWHGKVNVDLYRQYDQFSPKEILSRFGKPSLLMNGTADLNVPTSAIEEIQTKQKSEGAYPHVTCALLEGLEHSFRRAAPGETFIEVLKKPVDALYGRTIQTFLRALP